MIDTFTTHLTSASAEHETNVIGLQNSIQQKTNAISLRTQVIDRLLQPAAEALSLYIDKRAEYLNSLISSSQYLEWRTPVSHSYALCAFDGGANSLLRENGSFADWSDWSSSTDHCKGNHWSIELWSTATVSANRVDLPLYKEVILPDIKYFQNSWEGFHLISDTRIAQAGLSNTFTVDDLVSYRNDWDYGMEWIHSNPTQDFGTSPGINYQITSAENNITYFNTLTAASDRKKSVSSRFNFTLGKNFTL